MPLQRMPPYLAAAVLTAAVSTQVQANPLSEFQWKNRVLVVSAPTRQDRDLVAQRRNYEAAADGMKQRDIVLVMATGDNEQSRQIRRQLSLDGRSFKAVLVGKDGHTTLASSQPWTAQDLFGRIDAMPMRRDEISRGQ